MTYKNILKEAGVVNITKKKDEKILRTFPKDMSANKIPPFHKHHTEKTHSLAGEISTSVFYVINTRSLF